MMRFRGLLMALQLQKGSVRRKGCYLVEMTRYLV